eukprot:1863584-Pyramimonas_sp.AAC.1
MARVYMARVYMARVYMAWVYMARVYMARVYGARVYMARVYIARVYVARVYMSRVYIARAYMAQVYMARVYVARVYMDRVNMARVYMSWVYIIARVYMARQVYISMTQSRATSYVVLFVFICLFTEPFLVCRAVARSILMAAAPHLNGHYTVFGEVVSGWEVIDAINKLANKERDTFPLGRAVIVDSGQLS